MNTAGPKPTPSIDDDRALRNRLAHGDPTAFDDLVALHQPRIARLVDRLLGWRDAEDVVQDVFLVAWKQLARFRGECTLATWLTAIALRQCRSRRRRFWRWCQWRFSATDDPPAGSPDATILCDERSAQVRQAVQQLPPADREVIVLYYLEQWSTNDIAALLGASPSAIDVRLHRARARLRTRLAKYLEE